MRRVMIVGGPGSGKSTLARAMGQKTGLTVYHMDLLHWQSGWTPRPAEDKQAMAFDIQNRDEWIFEGGLSATYDHRAARADTLIWLDLHVALRLWRVTKRQVQYWGRSRPDLPEGCEEGLNSETLPFYAFIWRTRETHRMKLRRLIAENGHLNVYHLRTPREVAMFQTQVLGIGAGS